MDVFFCYVLNAGEINIKHHTNPTKLTVQLVEHHDLVLGILVREQDGHVRAAMRGEGEEG